MKKLALLLLLPALMSCASMSDVIRDKDQGTVKVYDIPSDKAWDVAVHVFRWEGTDAIEEHRDEHYMLTSSSAGLVTMGTFMGAWVEPVNGNQTKVTVVTKRKVATNAATSLTESTFHSEFAKGVAILKEGKPLPVEKP